MTRKMVKWSELEMAWLLHGLPALTLALVKRVTYPIAITSATGFTLYVTTIPLS
jgi:hypothetical protein